MKLLSEHLLPIRPVESQADWPARSTTGQERTLRRENCDMEPVLLFVVEDTFQITGHGCVLAPGPSAEPGAQTIRVGDRLCLRKPNGQSFDTVIRGVEMLGRRPRPKVITAPILLPREITKDDVPIGTEVWLHPCD